MNIYVASSWRNLRQPGIISILRQCGHDVYDFRYPAPGDNGFSWVSIGPDREKWSPSEYRQALSHPIARDNYALDIGALKRCDACVLVLPAGRSASWELGYAMGAGKAGYVILLDHVAPELMYSEARFLVSVEEVVDAFRK